jgi:hypothetical protein
MASGRTDHWTKMHRSLAKNQTPSFGLHHHYAPHKFSVHTAHDHAFNPGFTVMCGPQNTTAGGIQGVVTAQLQWN